MRLTGNAEINKGNPATVTLPNYTYKITESWVVMFCYMQWYSAIEHTNKKLSNPNT